MDRARWIALAAVLAFALSVPLLGGCSEQDQESVPSARQQLDKAHAAADAASRAAAATDRTSAVTDGSGEENDAENDGEQ